MLADERPALPRSWSDAELRGLVGEGSIHRDVYLDAGLFEIEMQRLYARAWVYVAHESQVPNSGDYFTTHVGLDPVVVVRHTDGKVRVLYNRCAHRGAKVVNGTCGNAKRLRCLYHGWNYHTDGTVAAIPLPDGYGDSDVGLANPRQSMRPLARVESYRGFIFAKQVDEGTTLTEHLGDAARGIDELVDRAPDGEVELVGGFHRYYFDGNWKHQAENLADQYHAPFSHESSVTPDGYQFSRRPGDRGTRIKMLNKDGTPGTESKGQWAYPWGHNACGAQSTDGDQGGTMFDLYRADLERRNGVERTREILTHQRHLAFFYPNMDLHIMAQAVRVIRPIRVDLTEVQIFPVRLKGAPPEMFRETVKLLNLTHSCSSLAQTDDVEAFERVQSGLVARGDEWTLLRRGMGRDVSDNERGGQRGPQFSENAIRNQHRAWLRYMTDWTGGWA